MHVPSSCFAHKTNCFLTLLLSSMLKVPTMMKMRLQCVFIYFVPGGTPYNDVMANTERLRLKGVPLSGIRYMKG